MRHDEVSVPWVRLARLERWLARSRGRLLTAVCTASLALMCGLAPAPVARSAPDAGSVAPGDLLRVERRDPRSGVLEACDEVTVDATGRVVLRGRRVAVAGRTPDDLAGALVSLFATHAAQPLVVVRMTRPIAITVSGPADVCTSGPRTVPAGTRLSRLCEVLHPGRRVDASHVELTHADRTQAYDLVELAAGVAPVDPMLEAGDAVSLRSRDAAEPGFWVLGAAHRPGRRAMPAGLTVSGALDELAAAGPQPTVHLVRGWPERPRIHRLSPADDVIPDLAIEAGDMVLVSPAPTGLLGERPALAALVMSLAGSEPVVLAACAAE